MDISQRFTELQETGAPVDDAIRQIFREDYNADINELMQVTGLDGARIGRIKGQVSRKKPERVTPQRESIATEKMAPPMLIEFRSALDDLDVGRSSDFREHLCKLFVNRIGEFQKDKDALEAFLYKHALTPVQVNGVVERITVPQRGGQPGQLGGYQTIPLPGGGAIILQTGQPQPQAGQPIVLGYGQGQPTSETAEQARQQAKMESRIEKLEELVTKVAEVVSNPPEPSAPPMRKGRNVKLDQEGNIMTDTAGNILYDEYQEPWEPGARDTVTDTILPLLIKQAIGEKPKQVDEEVLVLKIKEKLAPGGEGKITSEAIRDAVRSEMSGVRQDVETIKQEQVRRERAEEIDRAVEKATGEYKTIIQGLSAELGERGGFKGMTDSQIQMKYQKDLVDTMVDAFERQSISVREDIKPFILQQAVQSMKMQGISDDIIGQFLSSARQRIPATGIVPETSKEEAVDRVKKWAKS